MFPAARVSMDLRSGALAFRYQHYHALYSYAEAVSRGCGSAEAGDHRDELDGRSECVLGGLTSFPSALLALTNCSVQKRNQGTDLAPLALFFVAYFVRTLYSFQLCCFFRVHTWASGACGTRPADVLREVAWF